MFDDYIAEVLDPDPIYLDISELPRGVDNYHIDVKLSQKFCADLKKLLPDFVKLGTADRPPYINNENLKNEFRNSYQDMMTVLIHRMKTDLNRVEVIFLQFAPFRYVLESTRNALDAHIQKLRKQLSESRSHNSGKALSIQEQIFRLNKNYNNVLYGLNKRFFTLLEQVENKSLRPIRLQYLEPHDQVYADILFNPMLLPADIDSSNFLIEQYLFWNRERDKAEFIELNELLEDFFSEHLPAMDTVRLVDRKRDADKQTEIYDDLGGFAACAKFLGPSPDTRNIITEDLCWLDVPSNFEHLCNPDKLTELCETVREQEGFSAWRTCRGQVNDLEKVFKRLYKILGKRKLLSQLVASTYTRRIWSQNLARIIEPYYLCRYLGDEINIKTLKERVIKGQEFSEEELDSLQRTLKDVREDKKRHSNDLLVSILKALSLYRRHLQYFRFAHRAFNRISILDDAEKIRLSSQAGTLYQMPTAAEVEEGEDRIVHHTILKADVRGSTTVTDALETKDLNPASYFSLRFFSPINKVLPIFGANKVFIEGDAVILSFLEHEHNPQQWFSVARACGVAKAMLAVVQANNKYSTQIGLPHLELGIGICYADYAPRFLYDGDQPIMISSAIGLADRMSSCSWKLREAMTLKHFNVEVLEIAADDQSRGEKGQQVIRYNVNGILLDNEAFDKLQTEVAMRKLTSKIDGVSTVFYYGEYPDTEGRKRGLVVREGRIGLWKNESMQPHPEHHRFYEVVTNGNIIGAIQKAMDSKVDSDLGTDTGDDGQDEEEMVD